MRKLPAAIAVFTLAATLSTPAWADTVQRRHHHLSGQSDARGDGNPRSDREHHDDDVAVLF